MGILLKVATFPVSLPLDGLLWVAEKIKDQAEAEFYDEGAVRGRLLADLSESTRRKDMDAIIRQLVDGGVVEFFSEINMVAMSGALIPVDWSFSPIRDDSGKVSGIVAVGRDLLERRALEQHLYQSEKLAALTNVPITLD